jgi:hypothetical protein
MFRLLRRRVSGLATVLGEALSEFSMAHPPTILTGAVGHMAWWVAHHLTQSGNPRRRSGDDHGPARPAARVSGHAAAGERGSGQPAKHS